MKNFIALLTRAFDALGGRQREVVTMIEACIPCIAAVETGSPALLSAEGQKNFQAFRDRTQGMEAHMLSVPAPARSLCCPICGTRSDAPRHRMRVVETFYD